MSAVRWMIGALMGSVSKILCDKVEKYLLSNRDKKSGHTRTEDVIVWMLMAVVGAVTVWRDGFGIYTLYKFLFFMLCEVIAMTDFHHRIIPNSLLLGLLMIRTGLLLSEMTGVIRTQEPSIVSLLIGLAVGGLLFFIPAVLSAEIGAGDIKLAAVLGFCLGITDLLYVIVLAGVGILVYMFIQKIGMAKSTLHSVIPLGPFLATAAILIANI